MTDSLSRLQAAIGADFTIEGELGSGAMGTVYRVHDRKRGETIALKTLHQLARGVAALHRAGKIHRDLKPSNVLVTDKGQVKILDFGSVTDIAGTPQIDTVEHAISGTVGYMAPEQCAGEKCGPESDMYAVGVLLFEALTGILPFSGPLFEVFRQKCESDAPRPDDIVSDLPGDLVELYVLLLAREPSDRPSDQDLLSDLRVSEPAVLTDYHTDHGESETLVGRQPFIARSDDTACTGIRFGTDGKVVQACGHVECSTRPVASWCANSVRSSRSRRSTYRQ